MRKKMILPPGPPEPAIVGSLRSFGKKPLVFFQSLVPYGDIASFHLLHTPCYFVNRPEYVKQVLQEHNQHYGKQTTDFKVFRNVLGNGLFTSEGAFWLRQRRLMQPAFHRKQVEQFGQLMTHAIEDLMDHWEQRQQEGPHVLNVWEEMRRLSLRIVGEALFGIDPSQDVIGQHFAALERYIMDLFQSPLVLPRWIPTSPNRRLTQAQRGLTDMIIRMIADRRQQKGDGADVLTMLMQAQDEEGSQMTDAQIRDEVTTLLFAGHETTAASLTSVWYMLAKHPEIEQQLHAELDQVLHGRTPTTSDIAHLTYTRMVIDETLRLWPAAFMTNRSVLVEDQIGGYRIPQKSVVFVCPYTLHRHPAYWNEPFRFDPMRFSAEQIARRPCYTYFPFGGGPHLCIGTTFALTEMVLAVATIAQRYHICLVNVDNVKPDLLPALRPKHFIATLRERT